MCLWKLLSIVPLTGGILCLHFAWSLFQDGEIVLGIILSLFGIWSVYGGLRGMTRRELPPNLFDSKNVQKTQTPRVLTIEERRQVFDAELMKYVRQGWDVIKRSEIGGDWPFALLYRGNEVCNLTMDDEGRFYPIMSRR